jgi:hypothetical protein
MSEVWPSLAVLEIEGLEAEHKKVMKLDSEIKKIRRKAIKRVKKLRLKVPSPSMALIFRGKRRARSRRGGWRCCFP